VNRNINIILKTIEMTSKNVVIYIVMLIPMFIAFTLVSMFLWGPEHKDFSTFARALLSNLFLAIGYGDLDKLLRISPDWSIFYLLMYFFVMLFFLLSVFMGFYMDSYRMVMLNEPDR
jgi:hypothetical protein